MAKRSEIGEALEEALAEVVAFTRGEAALEVREAPALSPERIKLIRRKVAKTAREFELKTGIPAATIQNWEQGRRRPDAAGVLALRLIEANPEALERLA